MTDPTYHHRQRLRAPAELERRSTDTRPTVLFLCTHNAGRSCRPADVVITMGCGDTCPLFPGHRYEDWPLEDPNGLDIAGIRPIRDALEQRVRTLLGDLGVTPLRM